MSFKTAGGGGTVVPPGNGLDTVCYDSTQLCVPSGATPEGYTGQPLTIRKINGSVEDPPRCFVFDTSLKTYVEITDMSGTVGQPLLASSQKFATTSGDIMVCPAEADQSLTQADILAAVVTDGATFADGTVFDPANEDHELTSATVQSFYCGDDPCKTGVLVTTADACIVEESGETKGLAQGGTLPWAGSDSEGPVGGAGDTLEVPAGSAVRVCYTVRDTSQVIK